MLSLLHSGGSIVADLLSVKEGTLKNAGIHAAVRSAEQGQSLSALGVTVARLDLSDKKLVENYLVSHDSQFSKSMYSSETADCFQVGIVVNTATSIDREVAFNLIAGLSVRRATTTRRESYFTHVCATHMVT